VVLAYGVVAYVSFLAVFVAMVLWLANLGVVRGIDQGAPGSAAIDLALVALFGITHSVLARPGAKRAVNAIVTPAAERSTYVLVANITLALMVWQWRPLPTVLWTAPVMWPVQLAGIALLVGSTFLTNHFDLFGLRQVWLQWRGVAYTPVPFVERWIYTRVRHPMMIGAVLWLWATPVMTVGRMVVAAAMTAYAVIGVYFEERGLVKALGQPYIEYRQRVRAFIPIRRVR
jgi:methanethiol S-methyltransferase